MHARPVNDSDVLLFTHRDDRAAAVAAAIGRVWPELVVQRLSSAISLARIALRGQARLVLIDADADGGIGLSHHVARWRPDLAVLVLADGPPTGAMPARLGRWTELDDELRRCLALPSGNAGSTP